jgi:Inositol phospholipid synthesis and fat-storage-inducing TM
MFPAFPVRTWPFSGPTSLDHLQVLVLRFALQHPESRRFFMPDIRKAAFAATTGVLLIGTIYSIIYNTYLDTSNPYLTHLPHPLGKTDYFANKANLLNVIFIKRAWGWTSAAFLFLYLTSPPDAQVMERMYKWLAETAIWLVFTSWFFGPAVLERVIALSGGECMLALPTGGVISVPQEYCNTKSPLSPSTHPSLFATPFSLPDSNWHAIPRLRRGHDISGHVFLLTMSIMFLADQLHSSIRRGSAWATWPYMHKWAAAANVTLIAIWLFASYTTSVYFHTAYEKLTGYRKSFANYDLSLILADMLSQCLGYCALESRNSLYLNRFLYLSRGPINPS